MPGYDQIIKGEVSIEKGKCNNYIITFQSQTDMFLVYQVFTAGDIVGNKQRIIQNMSQKSWCKLFQNDNHVNNFTPTTIMHIGEQLYAFVINNVKICNGNMKFYVSSNLIYNNSSDVETDLPTGKSFARFDIDDCLLIA